ncbi:MAG: hypothetical protein Q9182_005293 [Xanthomendoza sp. 2 TL-2023]
MIGHHYQPLPPIAPIGVTPPFIRLLLLAPGDIHSPLAFSFTIVDVHNAPPFEALSYCWGREVASSPIWCGGHSISIKVNLDLALRSLRLPNQARRLRVDALCIDQSNTDERSRQVRYIRLMYKQAARTIVWLGPKTQGIEEAFRFAHTMADIRAASGGHFAVSKHSEPGPQQVELEIITELFDAHPETVNCLIQLFERDYFMRIWCVQENVVSAWCTAKCEDLETDFLSLLSCAIHVNMRRSSFFAERPQEL